MRHAHRQCQLWNKKGCVIGSTPNPGAEHHKMAARPGHHRPAGRWTASSHVQGDLDKSTQISARGLSLNSPGKASLVHKVAEEVAARVAQRLARPARQAGGQQVQGRALWSLPWYQLCNRLSAWAASVYTVTTRKSGKTCFVVVEGFSWVE